ncbi:MarR family transcriptional regulator [Streptomyces sp. NPDC001118]
MDASRVHAEPAAVWANSYPDTVDRDEVDGTAPVAMYLAGLRNRKGGSKGDRYHVYLYVVFELDVPQGGVEAVARDAAAISALLTAHGIRSVRVVSGPSGGMHVWAACPQGLPPAVVARIATAAKVLFPTMDTTPLLNPASGAVRPPGAPHRQGGHAQLAEHSVDEAINILKCGAPQAAFASLLRDLEAQAQAPALWSAARAALAGPQPSRGTGGAGGAVPPSVAARGPVVRPVTTDEGGVPKLAVAWRPLTAGVWRLAKRHPRRTPGAHQAAVHPVLRALAAAGWDRVQAAVFAADPVLSPALEWLRTASTATGERVPLTEAEAEARLARAWWLAVQDAARMPRRPTDTNPDAEPADSEGAAAAVELLARMAAAGPAPWIRPSGPADRAILRAVAWLMAAYGPEVTANVRRMAVLAGYSKSTAALSLNRVTWDGWIETAKDADRATASGRRIRLADAHQCTGDAHHMCAPRCAEDSETADHHGSDRSGTPRPPKGGAGVLSQLEDLIAHQQAGIWHRFGHHAARTLEAIKDHPGLSMEEITARTGYTARTTARHCTRLLGAGLVRITAQGTIAATGRSLYEAGAELGVACRTVELATVARIEQSVHLWWCREEAWWQLDRDERRRHGARAGADQEVLPGLDPYARAYPRDRSEVPGELGDADHARAFAIEATRLNAAALAAEAAQLARAGRVIDPAGLGSAHDQAAAA